MAREVYFCQTKLSKSQMNPTHGGRGHSLLLLSRHLSLSYLLLLYASLLLQMSWGSVLVIDRLWFVLLSMAIVAKLLPAPRFSFLTPLDAGFANH